MRVQKFKKFGFPKFISSGITNLNHLEYRFIILEKYKINLEDKIKLNSLKILNEKDALLIMKDILFVLEYIHTLGYSHGDIKATNILLDNQEKCILLILVYATDFLEMVYIKNIKLNLRESMMEQLNLQVAILIAEQVKAFKYKYLNDIFNIYFII